MTKEVLLSIHGVQFENDPTEAIEVITVGEYYTKEDKHYILYEEVVEESSEIVKCTIKIKRDRIEIIKKGFADVHMIFEERKNNVTYYDTPYGAILVGICANKIKIEEQEDSLDIKIQYSLEMNNQHISNCEISMKVTSKEKANIQL